ncbi:MAG: hypothetical protein FJ293_04640 [Planctomycetes bacterium]|nr:hypothetical protein [Planctomycetota bacterium]
MGWFDRKSKAESTAPKPTDVVPSASGPADASAPTRPPERAAPSRDDPSAPLGPRRAEGSTVRAFDQAGRPVELPAEVYWQQILQPSLERAKDDADALARVLQGGLKEQLFAPRLLVAAQRLIEIDRQSARSRVLLGLTQLEAGQLDLAVATLAGVSGSGEWPAGARHAEARIAEIRGDLARAQERCEAALAAEPSYLAAFSDLLRHVERGGGAAAVEQLVAARHAGGACWPASVKQVALHLARQDVAAALAVARELLARDGGPPALFAMVVGELGRGGQAKAALDVVLPRFDLARHGAEAALNLVQCCIDAGEFARGRPLLHQVALLPRPDLLGAVDELTVALDTRERASRPAPAAPAGISIAAIADPLLVIGTEGATWLVPPKSAQARVLVLTPWVVKTPAVTPQEAGAADGRFARGAAALLMEQVWLHTAQRAALIVPVVPKSGFAALQQPLPAAQLSAQWPESQRRATVIVTMRLDLGSGEQQLELEFFDAAKGAVVARGLARAPAGDRDALVVAADKELRGLLEPGANVARLAATAPPAPARQVDALASALHFVLAGPGAPLEGTLLAERHQLRRLLLLAEADPVIESLDALFAAMLSLRAAHGSEIPSEFAPALREWFLRAPDATLRARLAVAPLRALRQVALWRQRREKIIAAAPEPIRAWIGKVEGVRS